MTGPQEQDARYARLLPKLFWAGVGLAPLVALLLLIGQSSWSIRVAAILAVLSVVLIGLSIALRRDPESIGAEINDAMLDEMERLRAAVRDDITVASRNTFRAMTERVNSLAENLNVVRAQLEELQSRPAPTPSPMPQPDSVLPAPPPAATSARAAVPAATGVIRHTETVHVTRHTTVDAGGDEEGRGSGTVYGSRSSVEPTSRGRRRQRSVDDELHPAEAQSYGGEVSRERRRDEPRWGAPGTEERWESDEPWERMAAGDRWASVRADERGREVRMGERRASLQSDGHGTEMRIEDRWAAMRQEEGPPGAAGRHGDGRHGDSRARAHTMGHESGHEPGHEPGSGYHATPALPAAPGEPIGPAMRGQYGRAPEPEYDLSTSLDSGALPAWDAAQSRSSDRGSDADRGHWEQRWERDANRGYDDSGPPRERRRRERGGRERESQERPWDQEPHHDSRRRPRDFAEHDHRPEPDHRDAEYRESEYRQQSYREQPYPEHDQHHRQYPPAQRYHEPDLRDQPYSEPGHHDERGRRHRSDERGNQHERINSSRSRGGHGVSFDSEDERWR